MKSNASTSTLLPLLFFAIIGQAISYHHDHSGSWHFHQGHHHHFSQPHISSSPLGHSSSPPRHSSSHHHSSHPGHQSSSSSTSSAHPATTSTHGRLNPNAQNCKLALPANALTAEGLSTPWQLLPPCSQTVSGQQAFAEAAVIDSRGRMSIYHPLIIDQGKHPPVAPVFPKIPKGSEISLFFGFNGNVLTLVDFDGLDTNASPVLQNLLCVNGLPGVQGDVFGQVSWCNTDRFWNAVDVAVATGQLQVPPLGNDKLGKQCPSTRSFEIVDQDQSDNLPTKYLLLSDGSTVQFTAANKATFPQAKEIDNASDESLIADFVAPVIGCTPFRVNSLDDPGVQVPSLATQELQALMWQQEPIAIVPLNDPDCLLTSSGAQSRAKTNAFRIGVNQPQLGKGSLTDDGSGQAYCNNLVAIQPGFLASFQNEFANTKTPDPGIGNNLFTFLANRFLQSLPNLKCPNKDIPVKCNLNGAGAATSCTIRGNNASGHPSGTATPPSQSSVQPARGNYSVSTGHNRVRKVRHRSPNEGHPEATAWFA